MQTAIGATPAAGYGGPSTGQSTLKSILAAFGSILPQGARLPEDSWRTRHHGILILLWLHVVALPVIAVISGRTLLHGLAEAGVLAAFALLAGWQSNHRRRAAALASLGLLTASAFIVHLSNGNIEAHFHFFVVIGVVTLYQDWVPFLLAIGMVLVHHGVMGAIDPGSVYDHGDALIHPWKWAAIHGGFVLAASVASIISWRLSEQLRTREEQARAELQTLNETLEQRVFVRTAQLETANQELAAQGRLFEQAKTDAEQASQAKSEFISRISHELRTPLNAILGFSELMEMDERSEEDHQALQMVLTGGRHLLKLINEVLDIARIEAGEMSLSTEPVDVEQVLGEAIALIRPLAGDQGVRIVEPSNCCDRMVMADHQRLKQVFLNLLSNAVKYSHRGGTVRITCEARPGERMRTIVADDGIGIPAEFLHRLFSPFDRLGAERTAVEGTGLGLALSKRLVEAMQGEIGAESAAGRGATFWIDLPMSDKQESRAGPADTPAIAAGALRPAEERLVLYIEDNLPNFALIERILVHRPHVRILPAMQGGLGLELAREHRPDLILLDVHLPDISGDEVLRRLRDDPRTRDIPIVMISADATPHQMERILRAGASEYLTKPIQVARFLEVLDTNLGDRVAVG